MLKAKVVNRFKDKAHDGRIYQPGETYPAEGYSADEERIRYLSKIHPEYGKIYLADVQQIQEIESTEEIQKNESTDKFPKHVGGRTYELSNGEKVKGKEEAIEAEKALKE